MSLLTRIAAFLLLGGAAFLGIKGVRDFQQTRLSYGRFEHPIQLDRTGRLSMIANVPGRSIFRPGGVLEINVGDEQPVGGKGTMKIMDGRGLIALETKLEDFVLSSAPSGNYLRPVREFETANGGPYGITVEVTEAFQNLGRNPQVLIARHFVSGTAEWIAFLIPLVISGLMLVGAGVLILRAQKVSAQPGTLS